MIVKLMEIPVVREITVAMLWYSSLRYGIERGDWVWFGFMTLVGVVVGAIFWFQYNRKRKDTGGGLKLRFPSRRAADTASPAQCPPGWATQSCRLRDPHAPWRIPPDLGAAPTGVSFSGSSAPAQRAPAAG